MPDCIILRIFSNNVEIQFRGSHVIYCTIVTACSKRQPHRGWLPPRTRESCFKNDKIIWSPVKSEGKNGKQYFLHALTWHFRGILKLLNRKRYSICLRLVLNRAGNAGLWQHQSVTAGGSGACFSPGLCKEQDFPSEILFSFCKYTYAQCKHLQDRVCVRLHVF